MREAFEKWYKENVDKDKLFNRSGDEYCSNNVQLAWEAYQAGYAEVTEREYGNK